MNKKKEFDKIIKKIKDVEIQGANSVAKAALKAYLLLPTKKSKKQILLSRPTEPLMRNVLNKIEKKISKKQILEHLKNSQKKINLFASKSIKKNNVVFTHCHSSTVVQALVFTKKKKSFEVYNTETRPLFQGRKTSRELKKAKIKVTQFVDSAVGIALSKEQGTKKVDLVFLGADAITKKGAINKVGSEVIARLAKTEKIPVYILADSWKFSNKKQEIEQRNFDEVWKKAPKKIKIKNPAFEFINKKYITRTISELGVLSFNEFLKKVR